MSIVGKIEAVFGLDDSEYRQKLAQAPGVAQSALSKVAGLAAGYLSFRAGVSAVQSVTSAYMVQEKAVLGVQAALKKQGQEWNLQSADLANYAGELQNITVYGDEATLATMSMGMNMGIASDQIKDATKAAMGLAASYGMDLNTAMMLIARAANGNTGMLSRYGISIDTTKSKAEQFAEVLKKGADGFQIAEANAKTLSGAFMQLGNQWGDVKEKIGELIAGILDLQSVGGGLTGVLADVNNWFTQNMDELIFEAQYILAYLKGIPDVLAQVFGYVIVAAENVSENFSRIFEDFTGFCKALGNDLWENIKGAGKRIAESAKLIWQGIKDVIMGRGTDAFASIGDVLFGGAEFSTANLKKFGLKEMPDFKLDFSAIEEAQAKAQERLETKLNDRFTAKGGTGNKGGAASVADAAVTKGGAAGSFSAAVLNAMLGPTSPEKETAKNTRKMARDIEKIAANQGAVYE